jgi:hypothetical protein
MDWDRIKDRAQALVANQQGLTEELDWDGQVLHGVRSTLRREAVHADAGLADSYAFSFLAPVSSFAGRYPKPRNDKVTLNGTQYRVLSVESDGAQALVRLNLGAIYQ